MSLPPQGESKLDAWGPNGSTEWINGIVSCVWFIVNMEWQSYAIVDGNNGIVEDKNKQLVD